MRARCNTAHVNCKAFEQKIGPKNKIYLKEIELSHFNHSIFSQKNEPFKRERQNWIKKTELCQFNVHARKWYLAYFVPIGQLMAKCFGIYGLYIILLIMYINFDK